MHFLMLAGLGLLVIQTAALAGDWWNEFGHAGLSAAIEQGLADHPDPVAALARIRAAESGVESAVAGRRPMAMADAAYRAGRERSMMTGGVEDNIDPLMASARLSWELDVFGRVGAAIDAAQAMTAMRTADADAIRLALSLDIADAYFEIARLADDLSWLDRALDDKRALRDRTARRVEAGLDDPSELRKALAAVQEAEHHRMEAGSMHEKAAARLQNLIGGKLPTSLPGSLDGFTLPPMPDLTGTNLYLARPDIVAAYQSWQAAEGESRSAARDRLPTLALVASAAAEGDDPSDPEEWSAWAGPMLSIPLWEPKRGSHARGAAAEAMAAGAAFESASLRALQEIDSARSDRIRSEAMIDHMKERERLLAAEEEAAQRKRVAGLVQDSELRHTRIERAAAARDATAWTHAALRAHLTLIGALGGRMP